MSKKAKVIASAVAIGVMATSVVGPVAMEVNAENYQGTVAMANESKDATTVVDAATGVPTVGTLTKDKWAGETDYTIKMNLWYGNNAESWRVYENGKLILEEALIPNSPNAQEASISFKDKMNGEYTYEVELVNRFGVTKIPTTVTHKVTQNELKLNVTLPESASGKPAVGYQVVNEDADTFQYAVYVANPNKSYVWAGKDFSVWGVDFETEGKITSVEGAASFTQDGNKVSLKLKQDEQLIPYDTMRVMIIKGEKNGKDATPKNIEPELFRGDIKYPENQGLPSSWEKGKKDLKASDLIADEKSYYDSTAVPKPGNTLITYNPVHPTQTLIGLPKKMPIEVNGENDVRLWIPSKYLAMGLATTNELFGLNPSFMVGLSIKENFTCALVPDGRGYKENPVEIDGQTMYWPIVKKHVDGPFQQEAGNFGEVQKQLSDYIPTSGKHEDYVTLNTGEADDPEYATAAISAGASLTITREFLYAIPKNDFANFIKDSKDPWAEFTFVDNAYNRGVYGLLQRNIFTEHREKALASTNINKDFELSGFANHIENIQNIMNEMDNEKENIYDAKIDWSEMENFLKEYRKFYANGVPTDAEWDAMVSDVKAAFEVLSKHWGDNTISFRYDFTTLLRVAQKYLPEIKNPAPSGATWVEQVNGANK